MGPKWSPERPGSPRMATGGPRKGQGRPDETKMMTKGRPRAPKGSQREATDTPKWSQNPQCPKGGQSRPEGGRPAPTRPLPAPARPRPPPPTPARPLTAPTRSRPPRPHPARPRPPARPPPGRRPPARPPERLSLSGSLLRFPRATSEGFLLCRSSAGAKLRVPRGCQWAAAGLPVGCRRLPVVRKRPICCGRPLKN